LFHWQGCFVLLFRLTVYSALENSWSNDQFPRVMIACAARQAPTAALPAQDNLPPASGSMGSAPIVLSLWYAPFIPFPFLPSPDFTTDSSLFFCNYKVTQQHAAMNVGAWCWYALAGRLQHDLLQNGKLFMESFRRAGDGGIGIWPILADKVASCAVAAE
jgi:hypothetical protein